MKLLLVARRFPPDIISGTETVFANLYRQAVAAGHEVRLVVGYTRDRAMVPDEALGVDLRGTRLGMAHVAMWRAARAEARRFRPDAVLSNSIEVPITGSPTATIVHDLNFGRAGRGLGARAREALYRWRCPRMDRIVAVSEATRGALQALGVAPEHVAVIHNGVDVTSFKPDPEYTFAPLRRMELCYPGRILPGKGQHVAVDAVSRLTPAEKERVHLTIVGTVADPMYFAQLQAQAKGQPVTFATEVPEIAPFYRRADLVLFPTLMIEGFGFTAVEGMACGKPVAWSEQPAIREATAGIGFPFPGGDVDTLRDLIRRFLNAPEPYLAAGRAGLAHVQAHYAWDQVWTSYERVLRSMRR
jgi:glycosyltransferase involved in cell wall biosynthesis